jgi:hypothetical protein
MPMSEKEYLRAEIEELERLYLKEQTKSKSFMVATGVLGTLLICAVFLWPSINSDDSNEQANVAGTSQATPSGNIPLGGALPFAGQDISQLINPDGSVNTSQLDPIKQAPLTFKSQILDRLDDAVADGLRDGIITDAQAEEIYDAIDKL